MKTMILITLLLPMVLLNGCKDKPQGKASNMPDSTFAATPAITSNYYFAGEYLYQTDKATLKDQATGSTFTINNGEIATRLAEQYLALKLPTGKGVSAQLLGHLSPTNDVEHTSTNGLTVTQIILTPRNKSTWRTTHGRLHNLCTQQYQANRTVHVLTTS